MKYQKFERINTETTVDSTSKFASSNNFLTQNRQSNRHTSILAFQNHTQLSNNYGNRLKKINLQSKQEKIRNKSQNEQQKEGSFDFDFKKVKLMRTLSLILNRRKSYCFQIIKQFFIFPDETASSNWSVSTYDKLIFHDQNIHTVVKILQTKTIQNKIWGFLNLKALPKLKATKIITHTVDQVLIRNKKLVKKQSFQFIKQYSQGVRLRVLRQKRNEQLNQNQNKYDFVKKDTFQKPQKNIKFMSSTYSQQIKPTQRIKIESPVKIYRYQKSTISEYQKPKTLNTQSTRNVEARVIYPAQNYKNLEQKKEKINKYNIINYYERPRVINYRKGYNQSTHNQKCCYRTACCCNQSSCCQYSTYNSRQCCQMSSAKKNYGCINSKEQKGQSFLNQTQFTQHKQHYSSNYQLSELQSRIEYLKFLQKVVKEQEMEQIQNKLR